MRRILLNSLPVSDNQSIKCDLASDVSVIFLQKPRRACIDLCPTIPAFFMQLTPGFGILPVSIGVEATFQ